MIRIMYSTDSYHLPQQHHKATTFKNERTHFNYLNTTLAV